MLLTSVIIRLRDKCPLFAQRVAGTQSFVAATGPDMTIDTPACFVVPMYETATAKEGSSTAQKVTERFATILCLNNAANKRDGRGMSAEDQRRTGHRQLLDALLGWAPTDMPNVDTVQFQRGQHLFMNAALLWHQYEWAASYYVDAAAGSAAGGDPMSQAVEAAMRGDGPAMDSGQVRKVFAVPDNGVAGHAPHSDLPPEQVMEIMQGVQPSWVRTSTHRLESPHDPRKQFETNDGYIAVNPGVRRAP